MKGSADIELLRKLVAIPSVTSDIAANDRCQEAVADWLAARGVRVRFERAADGRKVLYAATVPEKVADFLLNAHTDVVPAAAEMFVPVERDGWLCGRGAGDCKGNVVMICRLLAELNGRASVGAVFSSDEEVAGSAAETMVDLGYGARKLVVVFDSQPYSLCTAEKGHVYLTVRATGRAAHASRPWEGDNALAKLLSACARIVPRLPHEATADDFWHETLEPTVVRAGDVPNRLPASAELTFNLRYLDPGAPERWARALAEGTGLEVEIGRVSAPVTTDADAPVLRDLARHLRASWPDRPVPFVRMNGATDARSFVKLGVPLVISSVEKRGDHADSEGVRLASLDEVGDAFRDFILKAGASA